MDIEAKKVLSQWEIDSLLGSLGIDGQSEAAEEPSKNIRLYDFRRPGKFAKEHLRALQNIHESFAHTVASSLSSHLRTGIQVTLSSIEQAIYDEYVEQLSNPTVLGIVAADPLPGHMIAEMNMGLAFALIDRLLGGTGQAPHKVREVTDVEMILLQSLIRTILGSLREAWQQILPVNYKLDEVVFNPEIVQTALPSDVGVLLLFELRMRDNSSIISMFLPYTMLEPIINKLSSQMWLTSGVRRDMANSRGMIRRRIERVKMPVSVDLGCASVTLRELIGLQPGDIITLDTSTAQELEMRVAGRPKFWVRPGKMGRRIAVSVTRPIQEEIEPLVEPGGEPILLQAEEDQPAGEVA